MIVPASDKCRMGEGYEPHVDEVDGRLIYSLPVDSGHVSLAFEYEIGERDLAILLADSYRRAVLHWVLHTKLQRVIIGTAAKISQAEFSGIVSAILYSPAGDVDRLIETINREHNIRLQHYIGLDLARGEGK